ncbi:cytosolic carboxypeptidase 1-like, partial [Fopius arisanus]|uniref:Cytosolic carboxypeptidase 1-like n=1 Tax=Fopius arisanus TaxID=64838 RepID=A0A9R1UAI9_9HYME
MVSVLASSVLLAGSPSPGSSGWACWFNLPAIHDRETSGLGSYSSPSCEAISIDSFDTCRSEFDSDEDNDDNNDGPSNNGNKPFKGQSEVTERQFFTQVFQSQRTADDLLQYDFYFKEFKNCPIQTECTDKYIFHDEIDTLKPGLEADKPSQSAFRPSRTTTNFNIMDISPGTDSRTAYCIISSKVKSVIPLVKVAYPDLINGECSGITESLNIKDQKVCRAKLLLNIERRLYASSFYPEILFDLDALVKISQSDEIAKQNLNNNDESRIGQPNMETKSLQFESRFESGNLRRAVRIGMREYDLILSPDVNSRSGHQWFYFEVSNMDANTSYTFNILNCEKTNSQFNFGMKPIMFSVIEATLGRPGWFRTGTDICYYRNAYKRPNSEKNYLTTSFTIDFPHSYDVCYVAYHFPFTYSTLIRHIWLWLQEFSDGLIYFNVDGLCDTVNHNECPVLTITSPSSSRNPIH